MRSARRSRRKKTDLKIETNGITFSYQIDGADGSPWLIVSNSFAIDLGTWAEQAEQLKGAVYRRDAGVFGGLI